MKIQNNKSKPHSIANMQGMKTAIANGEVSRLKASGI
jgi:hypothetical protein